MGKRKKSSRKPALVRQKASLGEFLLASVPQYLSLERNQFYLSILSS